MLDLTTNRGVHAIPGVSTISHQHGLHGTNLGPRQEFLDLARRQNRAGSERGAGPGKIRTRGFANPKENAPPPLLPSFIRELVVQRTCAREPESALVMDDPEEVDAPMSRAGGRPPCQDLPFHERARPRFIAWLPSRAGPGLPATFFARSPCAQPVGSVCGGGSFSTMLAEAAPDSSTRRADNVSFKTDVTRLTVRAPTT